MKNENNKLKNDNEMLSYQSVADRDELSSLRGRVSQASEKNSRYLKQIEDLSKRLAEERCSYSIIIIIIIIIIFCNKPYYVHIFNMVCEFLYILY